MGGERRPLGAVRLSKAALVTGAAGFDSVVALAEAGFSAAFASDPVLASPLVGDVAPLLSPDFVADLSLAAGFAPLLRKSVAYQPEPLSWNPAADNSFFNSGLWHDGHAVRGASLNFCSASISWPQAAHRYS